MKNYRMIITGLIFSTGIGFALMRACPQHEVAEALKDQSFMISPDLQKAWQELALRTFKLKAKKFDAIAQNFQDKAIKAAYTQFSENLKKLARKYKSLPVPSVPLVHSQQYGPDWKALVAEKRALKDRMEKEAPLAEKTGSSTISPALAKDWHDLGARKLELKAKEFDALVQNNKQQGGIAKEYQEIAVQLRNIAQELKSLPIPSTGIRKLMKKAPEWKELKARRLTLKARQFNEIADQLKARLAGKSDAPMSNEKEIAHTER